MRTVQIIDSTLREGEQVAGVALSCADKCNLAMLLDRAGVAELEVGMVGVSEDEDIALEELTRLRLERAQLSVATLIRKEHVSRARELGYGIISLVVPVSAAAAHALVGGSATETIERARSVVDWATGRGMRVNAALVDASREELSAVVDRAALLVESGAACLIYCDSGGCLTPERSAQAIEALVARVGNQHEICVHLHNDFGLATANAMAAVQAGATSIHVTVNGVGERAGVTSLAEVVLCCEGLLGRATGVRLDLLVELARTVERITGLLERPHAPGVGVSTFCCETGLPAGSLHHPESPYLSPVGRLMNLETQLSFGKHTGRRSLLSGLEALGASLAPETLTGCLERVKDAGARRALQLARPLEETMRRYHGLLEERRLHREELTSLAGEALVPRPPR